MEKRWQVFHGKTNLGLMTAKEIREALRQGSLDPFDKVALEGSNIREDLIEVDEIFKETAEAAPAGQAFSSTDNQGTMVAPRSSAASAVVVAPVTAQVASTPYAVAAAAAPVVAVSTATVPANSWRSENSSIRGQEDALRSENYKTPIKRYYILDGEKVLGPLSALEIQSLYNRGVINKKVKVQKIGGKRTMSIAQFIASYAGDRMKELAEDGKIPQQIGVGSPSSKVLTELARMASSQRVTDTRRNRNLFLVITIGVVLGGLLYLIFEKTVSKDRLNPSSTHSSSPTSEESENRPSRPRLVQKKPETSRPAPLVAAAPQIQEPPQVQAAPPVLAPPIKAPKKIEKANSTSKPKKPAPNDRASRPTPAAPASSPRSAIAPRPQASTPPAQASQGPIARAMAAAGRIQSIGPLFFSLSALEECLSKCTLILRDSSGGSMRAVFFKNAYDEALKSRTKGVTLTGSTKLDRGELTLIIQDVR